MTTSLSHLLYFSVVGEIQIEKKKKNKEGKRSLKNLFCMCMETREVIKGNNSQSYYQGKTAIMK